AHHGRVVHVVDVHADAGLESEIEIVLTDAPDVRDHRVTERRLCLLKVRVRHGVADLGGIRERPHLDFLGGDGGNCDRRLLEVLLAEPCGDDDFLQTRRPGLLLGERRLRSDSGSECAKRADYRAFSNSVLHRVTLRWRDRCCCKTTTCAKNPEIECCACASWGEMLGSSSLHCQSSRAQNSGRSERAESSSDGQRRRQPRIIGSAPRRALLGSYNTRPCSE